MLNIFKNLINSKPYRNIVFSQFVIKHSFSTNNEIQNTPNVPNKKLKSIFKKKPEASTEQKNTEDLFNSTFKEGMDQYLNKMSKFSTDFTGIKPRDASNSRKSYDNSQLEEKISLMLHSDKIREKGSSYLINSLIDLYKYTIGRDHRSKDMSYETYSQKLQLKLDKKMKKKIKDVFSRNEVIDSLNLIMRHINDLKSNEMAKFINILIKIDYSNFDNWKKILKQYIMYLSLITKDYRPLENKDVVQTLNNLKNMYNFLPYLSDEEIQTLLDRAIKESIQYIIKNIANLRLKEVATTITSMSKLGMLDEEVCKKIEHFLIDVIELNEISDADFANILFCIFKSKTASEALVKILEKKAESIIDYYTKYPKHLDPHSVTMILKSFYYGYRSESKQLNITKKIEELFINFNDLFQIHDSIIIAHALYYLDKPSNEFYTVYNKILLNHKDLTRLSEMLTFQIILVIMKRPDFSEETVVKYCKHYTNYVNNGQAKRKQVDTYISLLKLKIKKGAFTEETTKFLTETLREMTEFHHNTNKTLSEF